MSREIKGIIVSRLIVFISIIIIPVITFLVYNLTDFFLWFSEDPILTFWLIKILCPFVFSVAWLYFLILFANRFSQSLESMDTTIRVVPLRLKFFFGVNALFILFIFIFPLITPLVAALSFASMAWRLTRAKKKSWEDNNVSFGTRFSMIAFILLPVFCAVCIMPVYLSLSVFLWESVWLPLLDYIFIISYCLCTALAIGSLFTLIANAGVSEYEELYKNHSQKPGLAYVKIFEAVLFVFFLYLAGFFTEAPFEIIDFFYNIGFIIIVFVSVINFFTGKKKNKTFRGHVFGYLLAAVFMGSNLLIFNIELAEILRVWSLIISAVLFIVLFFYTFIKIEETGL